MNGEAGKGSARRPGNPEAYGKGHERLFGKRALPKGGRQILVRGRWVDPREMTGEDTAVRRKNDAHNIRSMSAGIHPDQIPEFEHKYPPGEGVTVDAATGEVIFRDRQARLKHLKARGLHCNDEIKG